MLLNCYVRKKYIIRKLNPNWRLCMDVLFWTYWKGKKAKKKRKIGKRPKTGNSFCRFQFPFRPPRPCSRRPSSSSSYCLFLELQTLAKSQDAEPPAVRSDQIVYPAELTLLAFSRAIAFRALAAFHDEVWSRLSCSVLAIISCSTMSLSCSELSPVSAWWSIVVCSFDGAVKELLAASFHWDGVLCFWLLSQSPSSSTFFFGFWFMQLTIFHLILLSVKFQRKIVPFNPVLFLLFFSFYQIKVQKWSRPFFHMAAQCANFWAYQGGEHAKRATLNFWTESCLM